MQRMAIQNSVKCTRRMLQIFIDSHPSLIGILYILTTGLKLWSIYWNVYNKIIINSCAKSAWYARRQHSYNICKDFLSHNSWMKNRNFTKKYTDHKTINSNNYAKFEVNWPRGSQFTAWHMKNCLQFDE